MDQLKKRIQHTPAAKHWARIGTKHHHGINVPVFCLRTRDSCGVGEFLDLLPLIDWCATNGFDVVQTLPLNDTSPFDNSPFSPTSSFSLNPYLLSLKQLPHYKNSSTSMHEVMTQLEKLNDSDSVQWKEVRRLKNLWLWAYLDLPETQDLMNTSDFKDFLAKNSYWLDSYALFCVFKAKYEQSSWETWPAVDWNNKEQVSGLLTDNARDVQFHHLLQYLSFKQMYRVKCHAESVKVFIKGDIPFLVSRDSADVWRFPQYFRLDLSAGAPPDMYSATGQNWGLPLYNWAELEKDDYSWWKNRLLVASQYFHIYRVDHIVGFFRVWGVPAGKPATEGSYVPSDESLWIPNGEKFLRMILKDSSMLPIGEDLGTVPMEVRRSLQKMGICGTKVIRWERDWEQKPQQPYIPYEFYNGDSMTTVSTHDSETLDQWWVRLQSESKEYCNFKGWRYTPTMSTTKRQEILRDSHTTPSLFHINLLNEYLALNKNYVHENIDKERINVPGKVEESNWSYRMRPFMEDVAFDETFKESVSKIIHNV